MPDFRAHWNRYACYSQNKTRNLQINQSYSYLYITCQSWLLTYIISHVSACAYARLRFSKQDSGKMFSDLALVILALFDFVWGCMMLKRGNNNSGERKSTGKLRKRKRVARSHWEDPHYMTQRKPEENTDDESYNMHWRIFRWDFLILIPQIQ